MDASLHRRRQPPRTSKEKIVYTSLPEDSSKGSRLLTYNDLPPWMHDNAHIRAHYRPPNASYAKCLRSLAHWHNETVNVWTHLLGAVTFLALGMILLQRHWPTEWDSSNLAHYSPYFNVLLPQSKQSYSPATPTEIFVFAPFFLGAVVCLSCSAGFHATSCHSHRVAARGNRADYVGIAALIWGSFIPSVYFGWTPLPTTCTRYGSARAALNTADPPGWREFYWGMISVLSLVTIVLTLHPSFRTPTYRPLRATLFVALGLSAVAPVTHGLRIHGAAHLDRLIGLRWLVTQGVWYILGAALYALRVPERWSSKGRFDVIGASHQLFHLLVLSAAGVHLVGLAKAWRFRREVGC